ncbi:MAG: META domain-containing protein [Anaerolineales bacterium]|nr:META domain-containing protein [Anaerolineales bacterium]
MKPTEFADILDQCLERLAAGEPLTQILADYPDEAAELRELLPLGQAYQVNRAPLAAPARQSQGKQLMLAAVDEIYPAVAPSWWHWFFGGGRQVVVAGAGLALVALFAVIVWTNNRPDPELAVVEATEAATEVVVAALPTPLPTATLPEPAITFVEQATPPPTATPLATATAEPQVSGAAINQPEAAVPQTQATATPPPLATPPPAASGGGGQVAGIAAEPNALTGQWQLVSLPADWLLILDEAGQLNMATPCGALQGAYAVEGSNVSFGPFNHMTPAGCSAEQVAQLQDLQLQLLGVVGWLWTGDDSVALHNDTGELILEMQKQAP